MKTKNNEFSKAGLAFFCSTVLCAFFNYLTLSFMKTNSPINVRQSLLHITVYVLQVAAVLTTIYYGERLIRHRKKTWDWYPMDILPDELTHKDLSEVIFVTTDGCLFNGVFRKDDMKFHGFDGLDFPVSQVAAWSDQKMTIHLKGQQKELLK